MIWDLHCHLAGIEGKTPEQRIAKLIKYADRMGVERLVFFMGFPMTFTPEPKVFRKENDQVLQALEHWHDRAFGFAYINPSFPEESVREMDRCIKNGPMVGIKLWVGQHCNHKNLDPIIHRATELKAVIFQHTWLKTGGNLKGESTPEDLTELAARHPKTTIICGHCGGDWERGIRAVRNHKNISVGLSGFDPTAGVTEMAVRELGAERLLYGSDISGRSFASQIAKVQGAEIPDKAKRMILGGNLRRMLFPILKAKGVRL